MLFRKKYTYIYKISWFHVIALLIRLLTSRVVLWKSRSPKKIEGMCESINPFDLIEKGNWLSHQDTIFLKWEKSIKETYDYIDGDVKCSDININYNKNIIQSVAIELQTFLIFVEAARKDAANRAVNEFTIIPPSLLVHSLGWELLCKYCDEEILSCPRTFSITYYIKNYVDIFYKSTVEILRVTVALFTKKIKLIASDIPIIWAGITPREMPVSENRLNSFWAVNYNVIRSSKVLYILPNKPSHEQERYSLNNKAQTIPKHRILSLLDFKQKIALLNSLLMLVIYSLLLCYKPSSLKKVEYAISSIKWMWIAKKLNTKSYIGSSSSSWPEQPEVAVMNAMGIKTITWMYSANTIGYSSEKGSFKGDGLERSTLVSKEYWVWSAAVKKYLLNRTRSDIHSETDINVVGSMMCGDSRYLKRTSSEIREELGINNGGYYIAIFDITIHSPDWMARFASSPLGGNKESLDAFYKGVLSLLDVSSDIKLLIKPKRKNDLNLMCDEYLKLTDEGNKFVKDGQVILLDPYMDPYLPIAAADGCIGMPFTSPILAALSEDRNGIYYDPCYTARYPAELEYKSMLLHKEEMLLELVKKWHDSKYHSKSNELILSIPPAGLYENISQQLAKCY